MDFDLWLSKLETVIALGNPGLLVGLLLGWALLEVGVLLLPLLIADWILKQPGLRTFFLLQLFTTKEEKR